MSDQPAAFVDALRTVEIPPNGSTSVTLAGKEILICNSNGNFYAIQARCSHADAPLQGGRIRNNFLSCPMHGGRFDLATGKSMGNVYRALTTYPVRIEGEMVQVAV